MVSSQIWGLLDYIKVAQFLWKLHMLLFREEERHFGEIFSIHWAEMWKSKDEGAKGDDWR